MTPKERRDMLIARTISVIAGQGLDKTTTKAITDGTGINEAYIYRYFVHKEDLLSKSFDLLDEELSEALMNYLPAMALSDFPKELRLKIFFSAIWKLILENKEKSLAYHQYFYSPYFAQYSAVSHGRRYHLFLRRFSEFFNEEADVWMLLSYLLNVAMSFAVKVFSGEMENNDQTEEFVFQLIYRSVSPYVKASEKEDS